MVIAAQLRVGTAIRHEGRMFKVLAVDHHAGQGQMGGVAHAHLQDLDTGTFKDYGFRADLKLEEVELLRAPMEFLYRDGDACVFMHQSTFEQMELPAEILGPQEKLLVEQMAITVESVDGRPVSVEYPEFIEVRVTDTAPPVHNQQDNTGKEAVLENGVRIRVPQFVKTGDTIRLDVHRVEYMERAKVSAK